MKKHFTDDIEIKEMVLDGLKKNGGYCPCILDSKGKTEYKCPCQDFRENVPAGKTCHCGLYVKDE